MSRRWYTITAEEEPVYALALYLTFAVLWMGWCYSVWHDWGWMPEGHYGMVLAVAAIGPVLGYVFRYWALDGLRALYYCKKIK